MVAVSFKNDPLAREMLVGRVIEAVTARVGVPPDRVELVPPGAVPKTSSGKIQRRESRRLHVEGTLHAGHGSVARQAAGLFVASLPARAGQLARRVARAIYGGYAAAAIVLVCFLALLVGRVLPAGPFARRLARAEARLALGLAGLLPRGRGLEQIPGGAAILVANHAGYLDFLICAATLPAGVRFVIKGELRNAPLVGPVLRRVGHVFIDRHSTARSLSDLDAVVELLRAGERVVLFPEGTFYTDVGMRPFKLGSFRLACETGAPVVPVAIRGSRKALRDGTWLPRHVPIEVEVLAPLRPEGTQIADIVRLRDRSADAIADHIEEPRLYAADIAVPGGG